MRHDNSDMRAALAIALCVLSAWVKLFAQDWKHVHKADDLKWAKETGLDPTVIHKLWRLASHFPDEKEDDSRIFSVDITGLADRHHVLLVTYAGEDNCLTLTVLRQYSETSFSKLWSADQTPDAHGFCDTTLWHCECRGFKRCDRSSSGAFAVGRPPGAVNYTVYAYAWNGITYRFAGQREMLGR